jgi:transcriptional regulator with XRE-family HTH domain
MIWPMNTTSALPMTSAVNARKPFGEQIREWRQRRHLSQMDLAAQAEMSTRHLSFLETGRSQPSRAMLLRLVERLSVPLRERNGLLIAAGFAPMYSMHSLSDPEMSSARAAVDLILAGHEPYPAVLVDRHWNLVGGNRASAPMMAGADASLLVPPVNVLRITLHPKGVAPRIENLAEVREHVLARLQRDFELTADETLKALLEELRAYPGNEGDTSGEEPVSYGGVVVPLKMRTPAGVITLFSTTTIFGTPTEVTLSELMLEAFYPADEFSANVLRQAAAAATSG